MRHLPAILLAGGVVAAVSVRAPVYAQQSQRPIETPVQAPAHAQQSANAVTSVPAAESAAAPAGAAAAATPAAEDDVFARARRLMAAGQEDSGRALIQSELNSADSGSARYVEALYWRAVLARTAADAERDLRTIVIDYPLSAQSDDALMRLAQLEMTRGENDQAMDHLERVVREHAHSASRPRASFWMARMLFEKGDSVRACARLADASATTPPGQAELRNQIDYLSPRCVGVDTSTVAPVAKPGAAPSAAPSAAGARPASAKPPAGKPAGKSAGQPPAAAAPAASAKNAAPSAMPTAAPAAASSAAHTAASSQPAHEFTVQVAAFSSHESAEHLSKRLGELGYAARITTGAPPYRVRVGRYATREAADSVAARMKTQHVDGYVTSAEPRR